MAAYARQAVARSGAGWTVSGNNSNLAAIATFPAMAGGAGGTVTHFGIGTDASGAGNLIFFGAVTPNISVVNGVTPKLDTGTVVTQAADGMTNAAATNFLNHFFTNADWAAIGDAAGLQNSAAAGDLFLSLHTANPGETGTQATSEIAYS